LAVSALSLLAPHTLSYDPWAWATWGREVLHLNLDTSVGPSWKPLPVMLDTVFALAGRVEPDLWLVVARTGCLAALVFAYRLGARVAGPAAGVLAAAWLASTGRNGFNFGWATFFGLGWSEGLVAALSLAAVDCHVRGRRRAALLCGLGAALIRVEAWPFLALYSIYLWRSEPGHRRLVLGAIGVLPLLWVVPDLLGSGELLHAGARAHGEAPPSIRNAAHPGLKDVAIARDLIPLPLALGALVALGVAVVRRNRLVGLLGAGALGWLVIVAVMAEAGYSGVSRYLVLTIALACVLGGIGWVSLARALARAPRGRWALTILALAVQAAFIVPRVSEVRREDRLARRSALIVRDLDRAVDQVGGPAAVRHCGLAATNPILVSALAWRLGRGSSVSFHSDRAAIVFRGRGFGHAAPAPALPRGGGGFRFVTRAGSWDVLARCPAL
jgi:hypothetical protein